YFAGGVDITEFGEGAGKIYKETRSRSAGSSLLTKIKFATIILVTAGFSLFGNGAVSARDKDFNPPNLYGMATIPSEPLLLVDTKIGNALSEITPIAPDSIVYSQEILVGGKKVNVIFSKEDRKRFGEAFEGGAEIRIYLGSIIRNTQKTLDSLFSKGNFLEGSIDSAALSGVTTQELGVSLAIDLARLVLIHEIIHEKRFQNDFRSQHDAELNYLFRQVELREGLERGAALELEAYLGMLCSGNYSKLIFSKLLLMEYSLKDSGKEEPYVSKIISRGLLDRMGYRKFIRKHHPESLKDFKTREIYHNLDFIKEFRASFQAEELKMRAFYFSRRVFLKDPVIDVDFNMDLIERYIKRSHFKNPADPIKNPIDQGFNSPIKPLRDQPREGQKIQGQAQTTASSAIVFSHGLTEADIKIFETMEKDTAATDLDDFELGLNTFVKELTGGEMNTRMKKNIISTLEELIANSSSKIPTLQIPIWTYFYPVKNDKTGKKRYIFELIIPASEKLDPKIDSWNMLKRNQEIFKVHGFEGLRVDGPKASGGKYQDGVRVRDQEYQNQGRGLDWVSSLMADTGVFLKYEKVPLKDGEGVTTHLYVDLTPVIVAHPLQPSLLKAGASSSSALTPEEQKAFVDFENFLMTKKVFGFGEEEKDYTFFVNWADESSDDLHNLGIYLVDPAGRRLEHHVFIGRLSPLTKEFFIEDWNPFLSFATTQTLQALSQALPGYNIKGLLTIMQIVEQFDGFGVFYDEETGFFKKLKEDRSGYYWISEDSESDSKRIMVGKKDQIISPEQLIAMTFFQDIEAASSFENAEIFWTKQENKGFKDTLQRLMLYYADADAEDKVTQLGIGDPLLAGMGSIEEFGELSFRAQFPENPQVISSSVASMKKVIEDFVDGRKAIFELNFADFEGMKSLGRFSDCKALDKLNEFFKTLPFEAESLIDYPWRSKNKHDTTIEMDLKEIIENSFDALESLEDARVLSRMPSDLRDLRSDVGQRKISVSLEVAGNNMILKVADNGAGIYAATTKEKKEGGRYIGGFGEGSASLYYSLKNIKGKYRLQKAGEKGRTLQEGTLATIEIPLANLRERKNPQGSSAIVARSGVKIYTDAQGRQRVDMATVDDADLKDFLNGINQPELAKKVFVYGGAARDLLFGSSVRDIDYFLTLDMTEDIFRAKVFPRLQATTIMKKHNMGERVRSLDDVRFRFGRTELSVNKMFLYFDGESPDPVLEDPQNGLKDLMTQTARITNDNDEGETRQKFSRIMEKIIRFGLTPDGRAQRVLRDCILYYKGQLIDFPVFNVYQAWDAIIHSGVNEKNTQAFWSAIERWQDSYRKDMAADRPMGLNDGEGELFEALGFKTPEGLDQHLEKVLSRTSGEAAVASSGIYGKWKDVMPKLLELADQKKVKAVYVDLDNTIFYPKGFVGSENQKTESIIRVAVNLIIKDVEKGEAFVSERTVAEAINQAKGLVYTQGDVDEVRMVDHQFFASDVDHEELRALKSKGVHMVGFTARPSKPSKMRITLDILRSLRVNGDIFDKVVFTSGDGKIKANQLAFQIKEYRREAKERKKQISSKEIFLIDDLKKNIIAAQRLGYGISPILIEADNSVENRAWEDFLELAKEAKREKNLNHVFEYLLNAYVLAPQNEERAILFLASQMLGSENYNAFTQTLTPDIGKMKDVFGSGVEMKDIVNPSKVFSSLINPDELEAFVRDQLNKSQVFESDYDPKRPGAASPLTKDTKGG
ncbi:MAG: hypothetical protein WCX16_04125, partial [Candidatus Omnitrophota bacterium]